jgi:hypothetical protein
MKRTQQRTQQRTHLIATLGLSLALSASALAGVELKLKGGQTWRGELNSTVEVTFLENGKPQTLEGKIVRADDKMVSIETELAGKVGRKLIFTSDVRAIRTLDAASPAVGGETPAADAPAAPPKPAAPAGTATKPKDGTPAKVTQNFNGVYVLPLKGMVGVGLRHDEIKKIGEEADKAGPGQIIVLLIESGGGLVLEGDRIHETLKDLKKRHRVVAWIKEAISAAAFTAMHCDEIYFMRVGAYGSITMFAGQTAISGAELDAWLQKIGEVAKLGGRDPQVAKCMVTKPLEVSYDIPEGGGPKDAIFYPDLRGKYILDTKDTMLTMNAQQAFDCGWADGIADTEEELAKQLGLPEWKEANDVGRKMADNWQRLLSRADEDVPKLVARMGYKGSGSGDPAAQLGAQIKLLEDIVRWYNQLGDQVMMIQFGRYGVPPKEALVREIEQRRKQLAEIRRQQKSTGNGN